MLEMLPAVVWVVAVIWAVAVCVLCVVRGKLWVRGHPDVEPLTWHVIVAQLLSAVVAMVPFIIVKTASDSFSEGMRAWYASVGLPAGIVLIVLVVLELVFMYLQARRAMFTEMDRSLHKHG